MDRKIALPVGLAVMVLLAVVGVLSLLSFTAAQPTEASNLDTGNLIQGPVDVEKLVAAPMATHVETGLRLQHPLDARSSVQLHLHVHLYRRFGQRE